MGGEGRGRISSQRACYGTEVFTATMASAAALPLPLPLLLHITGTCFSFVAMAVAPAFALVVGNIETTTDWSPIVHPRQAR